MHQENFCEARLESVNHALANTFGKYTEIKVWCKNAPLVQKFARTAGRLSAYTVFSRQATSHRANDLPSNQFPKRFGATAFHAPKAARERRFLGS